jgi:myb proto-oncogene protein
LDSSIDRGNERTGKWAEDEDSKLKDAVQTYCGKNWDAVAVLVPGRTKKQCWGRWHDVLEPTIDPTMARAGQWTPDEVSKLKDAVQTHGDKNWGAIAALVPGRTLKQCNSRWKAVLDPGIDRANGRTGSWTEDEDIMLKDAVHTHGKNWGAISALVPGRTNIQCRCRWRDALDPSIDRANGRMGRWTAVEDSKLKDAVQTHGGKNWVAISAMVPGRTNSQCRCRWREHRPGE